MALVTVEPEARGVTRPSANVTAGMIAEKVLPVGVFVLLIIAWELGVWLFSPAEYILPAPTDIWSAAVESRDAIWTNLLVTTRELVVGFILAVVVSLPLAMILVASRIVWRALFPILVVLQTVPKVAVAPLFVVWFGFTTTPKILTTFLICFFPVLLNTITGLRSAPPEMNEMLRTMGAGMWSTFRRVQFPTALPHFFAGLKIAVTLAVIGAVVAEFVGSTEGLGYMLLQANANLQTSLLFAIIAVLTLLGLALFYLVEIIERVTIPWHSTRRDLSARTL
ncbi:ABC transporter permease [Nocardioides conyzicola]|uniref:ABC transporter permease n=2 Tax=Nocardioides conyzicola TaxID=1651781 RepID=A0ABP8X328_9ACTN